MIDKIRKHPKIVLIIFGLCCFMFAGEIFIRYLLYPRENNRENVDEGPVVVSLLGKNLEFAEFKKKVNLWENYYGKIYKMYGLDDNSSYFSMGATNYAIYDFINDVSLNHIAKNIGISVEDDEKKDVIYGDNIDKNIQDDFRDKNGNFDRDKYDAYIKEMNKNGQMKTLWAKEQQKIFNNRLKDKVNTILKNLSFVNSLELKRKWEEENKTVDIDFAAIIKDEKNIDVNEEEENMKKYIKKHQDSFKNEEGFDISFFVDNFSLSKELRKLNLQMLDPLIKKFVKSKNPVEFAKIKSDQEVESSKRGDMRQYTKTYTDSELPKVFQDAKIKYKGLIRVELSKKMNEYNKIYKIYDIDGSKGFNMYKVAILYKKPYIDDILKKKDIENIEDTILDVNNKEEFKAFADEYGYKTEDVRLYYFLSNTSFKKDRLLKKTLYKEFLEDKSPRYIPLILDDDKVFVGFMNKYIQKDSIKDLQDKDVKDMLINIFKKKASKRSTYEILKNDGLLTLKISELKNNKKNKDMIFGTETNIKFNDRNSDLKNRLLKSVISRMFLLKKGFETEFINADNHLVKIHINDIKSKVLDSNSKEYIEMKNKEFKSLRDYSNQELLFESIYSVKKNETAYFLI